MCIMCLSSASVWSDGGLSPVVQLFTPDPASVISSSEIHFQLNHIYELYAVVGHQLLV